MGSHLDSLKIFTFPSSTNADRILTDHWHHAISNLRVLENFHPIKAHVLELIKVMQDEQVAVDPFISFPRRNFDNRDQRKLLELAYLTTEQILNKIKQERKHRLCVAYNNLRLYKFQKPWIVFLEEDEQVFLTENICEGDQTYFILRALQYKAQTSKKMLPKSWQNLMKYCQPSPLQSLEGKIHVIYYRTGTEIEGQLALFWLLLIDRSVNLNEKQKPFLLELTYALFTLQRVIPPFDKLPTVRSVQRGELAEEILSFMSRFPRDKYELTERLAHESAMRIMSIYTERFRGRRKGFFLDYFQVERYHLEENKSVQWFLTHGRPKFFWEREKLLEKKDFTDIERSVAEKIELCSRVNDNRVFEFQRSIAPCSLSPEDMEKLLEQDIADISMPQLDISFNPDEEDKNFNKSNIFVRPFSQPPKDSEELLTDITPPEGFDTSLSLVAMTSLTGQESFPNEDLSNIEPPSEFEDSLTKVGLKPEELRIFGPTSTRVNKKAAQLLKLQHENDPIMTPTRNATEEEWQLYLLKMRKRQNRAIEKCQQIKMQQMDLEWSRQKQQINTLQCNDVAENFSSTPKNVQKSQPKFWPYSSMERNVDESEEEPALSGEEFQI